MVAQLPGGAVWFRAMAVDRTHELLGEALVASRRAPEIVLAVRNEWLEGDRERVTLKAMHSLLTDQRDVSVGSVRNRIETMLTPEHVERIFDGDLQGWIEHVRSCAGDNDWRGALRDVEVAHRRRQIEHAVTQIRADIARAATAEDVVRVASEHFITAVADVDSQLAVDNLDGNAAWVARRVGDEKFVEYDWPFPIWNRYGKLRQSQIAIFGAPSGHGKSWFGLQMLEGFCRAGVRVAYFSMEMSEPELRDRLMLMGRNVSNDDIDPRSFNMDRVSHRLEELQGFDFTVFEGSTSIERIKSELLKARTVGRPYGAVVIDHLRLLTILGRDYRLGLQAALSDMRALANSDRIPFIVLAQLRRPPSDNSNYRPRMTDFAESGAIEQIADYAFLLKRDDTEDFEDESLDGSIWCDKRRGGRRFPMIRVQLHEKLNRFVELDPELGL